MKFNLTKPCSNMCPFHTECLAGWLGEDRAQEIADSLARSTFSCHATNDFDDEGDTVETDKTQHCAGALIMLEKMEQPSQMMRIAERLRMYDRFKLQMDAPVFETADDFVSHHAD